MAPSIQMAQDRYRAKFAISNQKNSRSSMDRLPYIGQQNQLLGSIAVSSDMFESHPSEKMTKHVDRSSICHALA